MASDKSTDFLKRNRPPRVNISYEDPYDSEKMVELPFVVGVMSDLSGNASQVDKAPMEERDFVDVTAATLDDYMKSVAPGLSFNVENKVGGEERLGVQLNFESMDDFDPAAVARKGHSPCSAFSFAICSKMKVCARSASLATSGRSSRPKLSVS